MVRQLTVTSIRVRPLLPCEAFFSLIEMLPITISSVEALLSVCVCVYYLCCVKREDLKKKKMLFQISGHMQAPLSGIV